MKCLRCENEMYKAQLTDGHIMTPVVLKNKGKNWLTDPERISSVSCYVCPECGYVELQADDPKGLKVD
jgi:hypothetical protein